MILPPVNAGRRHGSRRRTAADAAIVVLKPAFQHAFVDQLAKIPERLAGVGKAFSPKAWISPLSMMPPCMTRLLMG
jgi:hypothetical protein